MNLGNTARPYCLFSAFASFICFLTNPPAPDSARQLSLPNCQPRVERRGKIERKKVERGARGCFLVAPLFPCRGSDALLAIPPCNIRSNILPPRYEFPWARTDAGQAHLRAATRLDQEKEIRRRSLLRQVRWKDLLVFLTGASYVILKRGCSSHNCVCNGCRKQVEGKASSLLALACSCRNATGSMLLPREGARRRGRPQRKDYAARCSFWVSSFAMI